MCLSATGKIFPSYSVNFHVFTDDPEDINSFCLNNKIENVTIHKIEAYGWPEATLLRYEVYSKHADALSEDLLMHLDADMIVKNSAEPFIHQNEWKYGMKFVAHPGFWRPKSFRELLKLYLRSPRFLSRDLRLRLVNGGLGTWENREQSTSFVPRGKRRVYACGGVWFGKAKNFKEFCSLLTVRTQEDSRNGVVARWHDESHLNRWLAEYLDDLLSPELCYDASYQNLISIEPTIIAVQKP